MRGAKDKRMGSPPRMRGKACLLATGLHDLGITPAYAGKSVLDVIVYALREDHPRVCGEKISGTMQTTTQKGSPPRMRGKD